jgi:hypothetical protein
VKAQRTEAERRSDIIAFVQRKHARQIDKSGNDYFNAHLLPVAYAVDTHLFIPALSHDLLEDTDATLGDMVEVGYTGDEINIVGRLTHDYDVSYNDYIKKIRTHEDALKIKLADIVNNLMRMYRLDLVTQDRLSKKYYRALVLLTERENEDA